MRHSSRRAGHLGKDKMKNLLIFIIFSISLFGCNAPNSGNSDVMECERFIGAYEEDVTSFYGSNYIKSDINITKDTRLLEYQSSLYSFASDPNKPREIRELMWTFDKYTIVVWLRNEKNRWKVIDCLSWSDYIRY